VGIRCRFTVAIVLSAMIALTLSPMLSALVLKDPHTANQNRIYQMSERFFRAMINGYERILKLSLRHRAPVMVLNLSLIAISGYFFVTMPKGFFPQEDTGMLSGFTQADEDISFEGMKKRQETALNVVLQDPDVLAVGGSIGGTSSSGFNTGRMFIQLKAVGQRRATAARTAKPKPLIA
jgi:multidrug efflux pump subunit AcrB